MNALKDILVIEFEGSLPSQFAGRILADLGAEVIIISRPKHTLEFDIHQTILSQNKKSIVVDFKLQNDREILTELIKKSKILLHSMKPGSLEQYNFGYEDCKNLNSKLIYARISGFGYNYSKVGHDINFLAQSGIQQFILRNGKLAIPNDSLGAVAAGSLQTVIAILAMIRQDQACLIDSSITRNLAYFNSFLWNQKRLGQWNNKPGNNIFDGGAPFYNFYQCSCGGYMSVGCIETKFYTQWIAGLREGGLQNVDYFLENQMNVLEWKQMKEKVQKVFLNKSKKEWEEIYKNKDACCMEVLNQKEIKEGFLRKEMILGSQGEIERIRFQPKMSIMIGDRGVKINKRDENREEILHMIKQSKL